jgi:hypothetical protein
MPARLTVSRAAGVGKWLLTNNNRLVSLLIYLTASFINSLEFQQSLVISFHQLMQIMGLRQVPENRMKMSTIFN